MSRGSVKTMSDAISSDGIATTNRFARYRLSTVRPAASAVPSPIQPRRHQAAAVVVPDVWSVVLQRGVPHADVHARRDGDVVLLLREVALDLVHDLAPLADVED